MTEKIRKKNNSEPDADGEDTESKAVIEVKGMMCEHCEKRVKDCLEALPFVDEAVTDFNTGKVQVTYNSAPDLKVMKKRIKEAGYGLR